MTFCSKALAYLEQYSGNQDSDLVFWHLYPQKFSPFPVLSSSPDNISLPVLTDVLKIIDYSSQVFFYHFPAKFKEMTFLR